MQVFILSFYAQIARKIMSVRMEVHVVEAHVLALKDLKGRDVKVRVRLLLDFTLVLHMLMLLNILRLLFTRLFIVFYRGRNNNNYYYDNNNYNHWYCDNNFNNNNHYYVHNYYSNYYNLARFAYHAKCTLYISLAGCSEKTG